MQEFLINVFKAYFHIKEISFLLSKERKKIIFIIFE